jgi:calcineurin-like phosphoesterase family protein
LIYFTSDTHFWHRQIIAYCKRPFADVESMNEALITNWNERVGQYDEVWFLGDFCFCGTTAGKVIFSRLHGLKHLVQGNHDRTAEKLDWYSIQPYKVIRPHVPYQDDDGVMQKTPHPIVLMHFPILSWDLMAHGSWHLHGHCHGSLPDNSSLRMDVGVDPNSYRPVSLDEVQAYMALRTVVPTDYHGTGKRP